MGDGVALVGGGACFTGAGLGGFETGTGIELFAGGKRGEDFDEGLDGIVVGGFGVECET